VVTVENPAISASERNRFDFREMALNEAADGGGRFAWA
jgi:hypothetical protein